MGGSIYRSFAVILLIGACLALVFCFPVTAAEVSGAEAGGSDGFRQATANLWYLAEGTTYGGMETWVVVQNPNATQVTVDLTFYTENGKVDGPQDFPVPAQSRRSFFLNTLVPNMKDVSTKVVTTGSSVVCERAVYGPGKAWAQGSVGHFDQRGVISEPVAHITEQHGVNALGSSAGSARPKRGEIRLRPFLLRRQ
ncbi:MAG: hypothetical protein H5T73_12590 [Actinobacteria bacterium]|nr:hypothetical protein [Actinomycetota bacterium]